MIWTIFSKSSGIFVLVPSAVDTRKYSFNDDDILKFEIDLDKIARKD